MTSEGGKMLLEGENDLFSTNDEVRVHGRHAGFSPGGFIITFLNATTCGFLYV